MLLLKQLGGLRMADQKNNFGKFFDEHPDVALKYDVMGGSSTKYRTKYWLHDTKQGVNGIKATAQANPQNDYTHELADEKNRSKQFKEMYKRTDPKKAYDDSFDEGKPNIKKFRPLNRQDLISREKSKGRNRDLDLFLKFGYNKKRIQKYVNGIKKDKNTKWSSKQIKQYATKVRAKSQNPQEKEHWSDVLSATKNPKLTTSAYLVKSGKLGKKLTDHKRLEAFADRSPINKDAVKNQKMFKGYDQSKSMADDIREWEKPMAEQHEAGLEAPIDDAANYDFYQKHIAPKHAKAYEVYEKDIKTHKYAKPQKISGKQISNTINSTLNKSLATNKSRNLGKSPASQLSRGFSLSSNHQPKRFSHKISKKAISMKRNRGLHR